MITDGVNDRVGHPIRLNVQTLEAGKKGYAAIVPLGDIHYGHPCCDIKRVTKMRDYCLANHIYVIGMGDYIECGTRESVGDSVYEQEMNPRQQTEVMVEFYRPLAEAELLLGMHGGNHEDRVKKLTSFDPAKLIAKELGVHYLGDACWSLFRVGKQNYTMYSMHGASGSRFEHTKMKAAIDISNRFEADIILYAHVHYKFAMPVERQRVNVRNRTVEARKVHVCLTGHWMSYDDSYAQKLGFPPCSMGAPKVELWANRWDIHSSV